MNLAAYVKKVLLNKCPNLLDNLAQHDILIMFIYQAGK
jgi:hypothetical protein